MPWWGGGGAWPPPFGTKALGCGIGFGGWSEAGSASWFAGGAGKMGSMAPSSSGISLIPMQELFALGLVRVIQ